MNDTAQARGQSLTIREADTSNERQRVKCNRCKKRLSPGNCVRDKTKSGYVCKGSCR